MFYIWHSSLSKDRRGMELVERIDDSAFCMVNDEALIRIVDPCNRSPDIAIANLVTYTNSRFEKPPDFVSVDNSTFVNSSKAN